MKKSSDSIVEKRFSCLRNCPLNQTGMGFFELLERPDSCGEIGSVTVSRDKNVCSFLLRFAPTGNFVADPYVIICGKTADWSTQEKFWRQSRAGAPAAAAYENIFSTAQTRNTLYQELSKIGLFDFLRMVKPDKWEKHESQEVWNKLFLRDSWQDDYGLQLTQACNCAILRTTGRRSRQPERKTVQAIAQQNPSCLFSSFPEPDCLTNLKLVIFLDTPSDDTQFHPAYFFHDSDLGRAYERVGIRIISIPHPAGLNYGNMKPDNLSVESGSVREANAARLLTVAEETISTIMDNCIIQ